MNDRMNMTRSPYTNRRWQLGLLLAVTVLVSIGLGCSVYFNTFFNCKKAFNQAEKSRRQAEERSGRSGGSSNAQYNIAIEKALKVVDSYPDSKYYDDALFILAVSYYHTEQYSRAERRFRELLANFGDSKYAREGKVYLAKAKLALGDVEEAKELFEEVFQQKFPRKFKAEAAEALGAYHFEKKEYDQSRTYFQAIRDSLGEGVRKVIAQTYIADGYFEGFLFADALGAYLQILGMDPDKNQRYHALYRAAVSSYRLQRIEDGMAYLDQLRKDEDYYDSTGILELTIAEGMEYEDDLVGAEAVYAEVARSTENKFWEGLANYRLGLIYQFDYDQLDEAKRYYDKAVDVFPRRSAEEATDALQRSSDIGKLETFARTPLDSGATADVIDEAAYTQYQLANLYWFALNKPDSAIIEMLYMVDSFPTAFYTPKGLIALSQMYREQYEDNKAADSLLKLVLMRYPHSDYVPEALDILGLRGTAADTGYAQIYIHRAEDFLVDRDNPDSAMHYYQYVVDHFPESQYFLRARFGLIWLQEMYFQTGDSTVYYAYEAFADTFPNSPFASEAKRRLGSRRTTQTNTASSEDRAGEEGGAAGERRSPNSRAGSTTRERVMSIPAWRCIIAPTVTRSLILNSIPSKLRSNSSSLPTPRRGTSMTGFSTSRS